MSNDAYFTGIPGGVSIEELRQRFAKGESPKELFALYYRQAVTAFRDPKNAYWNSPLISSERIVVNGKTDYRDRWSSSRWISPATTSA